MMFLTICEYVFSMTEASNLGLFRKTSSLSTPSVATIRMIKCDEYTQRMTTYQMMPDVDALGLRARSHEL